MLRSLPFSPSEVGSLLGFWVGEAKGTIHFSERSVWQLDGQGSLVEVGEQLGGLAGSHERLNGGLQWSWRGSSGVWEVEVIGVAEGWDSVQRKMWEWERKEIRVLSIFISLEYPSAWWCHLRMKYLWDIQVAMSSRHTNKYGITTSYLPSRALTPNMQMRPYTVPSLQLAFLT